MARPDYGLDAPGIVKKFFWRGVSLLGFSAVVVWANRGDPGAHAAATTIFRILGSIGAAFLLTSVVMIFSSRVMKPRIRDRVLDALNWRGDERVLDVGCGRGLMLIGAAKRLKSGRASGVDVWSAEDLSSNSPEAAKKNAEIEGVAERIKIDNADARKLPYPDGHFDIVVSSLAIHNLQHNEEREKALAEMWRVLKPGGQIAIFDIFHTADYGTYLASRGATVAHRSGLALWWCVPSRWLVVRKG